MPLECVAIKNAAQNQIVSGSLLACLIVPAVTEVCRPAIGAFIGKGFGLQQPSTAPRRNPGRQTLLANGARRGTPHTRLPWRSGPETRSMISEKCPSDPDTTLTPALPKPMSMLTLVFLFCTLNLD